MTNLRNNERLGSIGGCLKNRLLTVSDNSKFTLNLTLNFADYALYLHVNLLMMSSLLPYFARLLRQMACTEDHHILHSVSI